MKKGQKRSRGMWVDRFLQENQYSEYHIKNWALKQHIMVMCNAFKAAIFNLFLSVGQFYSGMAVAGHAQIVSTEKTQKQKMFILSIFNGDSMWALWLHLLHQIV